MKKVIFGYFGCLLGLAGLIMLVISCFMLSNNRELAITLFSLGWVGIILMWVFVTPVLISFSRCDYEQNN